MDRVRELDALRGLGALVILMGHYWISTFEAWAGGLRPDFFFVLSGFMITKVLMDNYDDPNYTKRFYVRRAIRIWPTYYLLLLVLVMTDNRRLETDHITGLLYALTFTQNTPRYWSADVPQHLPEHLLHTWSLALEQQFYIVWPIFIRLVGRKFVATGALWIAFNSVLARIAGLHPWTLLARFDGLALGAVLAVALSDPLRRGRGMTRLILALLCLVGLGNTTWYVARNPRMLQYPLDLEASLAVLSANLFYVGLIGLVICFAGRPALAPLRYKPLCDLGRISYGVYLYSFSVLFVMRGTFGASSPWIEPVAIVVNLATAMASWVLIERPLTRIRGWWVSGTVSEQTPCQRAGDRSRIAPFCR
jgi:peptidoglycan/LPS O-acetylase OafA/YrhL